MQKKFHCFLLIIIVLLTLYLQNVSSVRADMAAEMNWEKQASFSDVSPDHWAYKAISVMAGNNLISGDLQAHFRPQDPITRAEAAKILAVYSKLNYSNPRGDVFRDVEKDAWYAGYAESSINLLPEIFGEDGNRYFHPSDLLGRGEAMYAAVKLVHAEDEFPYQDSEMLNKYSDSKDISSFLKPYIVVGLDKKIIQGYEDGTLRMQNSLTRAEFASVIYRCIRPKMHVIVSDSAVSVISKLNTRLDLNIILQYRGPNRIFDFNQWRLINNSSELPLSDNHYGVVIDNGYTDSYSPYIVLADATQDGDIPDSRDFTGGNHSYNNTGSGESATGRTTRLEVYVNGEKKPEGYSGYANSIDIVYTNRIQATNTKKEDGTGREVLEESNLIHFDGDKWKNTLEMTALEDVGITTYYGITFNTVNFGNNITYYSHNKPVGYAAVGVDSQSNDKACDEMKITGGKVNLEMQLDTSSGLGNFQYNSMTYSAFAASYGKVYFNLIRTDDAHPFILGAGDKIGYKGYYRYYSE